MAARHLQRKHDAGTLHEGQEVKPHPLDDLADRLLARKRKHSESNVSTYRKDTSKRTARLGSEKSGDLQKRRAGRPTAQSENDKLLAAVNKIVVDWYQTRPEAHLTSAELVKRLQNKNIFTIDNTLRRKIKRLTHKKYDEYIRWVLARRDVSSARIR